MSFFVSLLNNTGSFDQLLQGHYDENSNCGWVTECDEIKSCIGRVCAPYRDAYGGTVFDSCVLACNNNRSMADWDDFFCKNPATAWKVYGYKCPDYTPGNAISILGKDITFLQIASAVLLFIIIYLIIQKI